MKSLIAWMALALVLVSLSIMTHVPRWARLAFWRSAPQEMVGVVSELRPSAHGATQVILRVDGRELNMAAADSSLNVALGSTATIGAPFIVRYDELLSGVVSGSDTSNVIARQVRILAVYQPALN